jgi:hypothetical protein
MDRQIQGCGDQSEISVSGVGENSSGLYRRKDTVTVVSSRPSKQRGQPALFSREKPYSSAHDLSPNSGRGVEGEGGERQKTCYS